MQDPCHLFKCPTATESDCAVAIFKKILKVIAATGTAAAARRLIKRIFIFMRQTTTSTDYFDHPSVSSRRTYI